MASSRTTIQPADLAVLIDHTNLMPTATQEDIAILCREAREYGFASVCINSSWLQYAAELLAPSGVAVCSVVGFPLGAADSTSKAYEAERAVKNGAAEIDMVVNNGFLYDKRLLKRY